MPSNMKGHARRGKRGKLPREDSYLLIFSNRHTHRSRRKRLWYGELSLAEKKRLLACFAEEQAPSAHQAKELRCDGERPDKTGLRIPGPSTTFEDGAFRDGKGQRCESLSGHISEANDLESAETNLTLEDCWRSNDLSLQWLRKSRAKMEAFQQALRRRLASPVRPCHWPLAQCLRCTKRTCNPGMVEPARSDAACSCTYAQNCALIISEDPLLRLSLMALSFGVSEVHAVVMNKPNWESAVTVAKCFGKPDNLKVFRSLEALELDVFGSGISRALSGEVVPAHTCCTHTECASRPTQTTVECSDDIQENRNILSLASNKEIPEQALTVEDLQLHLHRYRAVLIDDHYCGPIVSAFGLPSLLDFCRTHTCPVCCPVLPRRWQTLMTPASCPPLLTSSQCAKFADPTGLFSMKAMRRRFAASGRAMGCSFLRLEDVSLSDRFCVFENFELKSAMGLPNAIRDTCGVDNISNDRTYIRHQRYGRHSMVNEHSRAKLRDRHLRPHCFRCARDRHILWTQERPGVATCNAVCGVEVAGLCAGFIMRSHILLDEGVSLPPSSPLMVFLPEEVPLSTQHLMMLGPGVPPEQLDRPFIATYPSGSQGTSQDMNNKESSSINSHIGAGASSGASTVFHRSNLQPPLHKVACDDDATGSVGQTEGFATSWRNLRLQRPAFHWQCAVISDCSRQTEFAIAVTLRDLQQAIAAYPVGDLPLPVKEMDCTASSCL